MSRLPLIAPILVAAILSIALVGPFMDLPIVDDFFHKRVVDDSIAAGEYVPHSFIGATIVLQIVYGIPFTLLFGEGYTPLRFSTLILAVAGAWAIARAASELGAPRPIALIAALTVWANPIYLLLAHSYMTDVPFFFCVTLSIWFQARGFHRASGSWIAAGIAMSFTAYFIRQHGLVVAIGGWTVAIYLLVIERRLISRSLWIGMASSTLVGMIAVVAWHFAYPLSESQSTWIGTGESWPASRRIPQTIWYLTIGLSYMGLFTAPLIIARVFQGAHLRWWVGCGLAFVVIALSNYLFTRGMTRMPYLPDYFYDFGAGQMTFSGTSMHRSNWKPFHIGPVWWLPTLIAILGAAMLLRDGIALLVTRAKAAADFPMRNVRLFLYVSLAGFIVGYAPFLPRAYSDRYLLTALAPAVLILAISFRAVPKRALWAGAITTMFLFVVATAMVHDYFAMTEARWAATDWLLDEHGADPLRVDGGYEYNGIHTMDHFIAETGADSFVDSGDHGFWLTGPPAYAIDLLPRDKFEIIHRESFHPWLQPGPIDVLVQRAIEPTAAGPTI